MISLLRNPYTWDKQNVGNILTPTTTNVKFISNGTDMVVQNLPSGEEVIAEMATPMTELVCEAAKRSFA